MIKAHSGESGGTSAGVSLLAVLVLLAVGGEALGLQELGRGSPLVEQALVFFEELLLFLQSRLLIRVEALQLLETTLQLEEGEVPAAVSLQLNGRRTLKGSEARPPPTSLSASFSSASFSFTRCTNICLISSSLFCSSTRNSWRLASYVCCKLFKQQPSEELGVKNCTLDATCWCPPAGRLT